MRKVDDPCACMFYCRPYSCRVMSSQVVHDYDIARRETWHQHFVDNGEKCFARGSALIGPHCADAIESKCTKHREHFASVPKHSVEGLDWWSHPRAKIASPTPGTSIPASVPKLSVPFNFSIWLWSLPHRSHPFDPSKRPLLSARRAIRVRKLSGNSSYLISVPEAEMVATGGAFLYRCSSGNAECRLLCQAMYPVKPSRSPESPVAMIS